MSGRRTRALRRKFYSEWRDYLYSFRSFKRGNVPPNIDRYGSLERRESGAAANNERIAANQGWHAKATYGKDKRAGSFAHHQSDPFRRTK